MAHAQQATPGLKPLSLGVFGGLGWEGVPAGAIVSTAVAGAYVESARYRFRPGLEVRQVIGVSGIQGTLTGPRVTFRLAAGGTAYAGALFGPQHYSYYPANTTGPQSMQDAHGITSMGTVGIEVARPGRRFGWYMEYSQGVFTGVPNSHPGMFVLGLVLRSS